MSNIAPIEQANAAQVAEIGNPSTFLFDTARMTVLMKFADMMSQAVVTVPRHLHGKPADCLALTLQAMRWGMDPYVVASKTHVVNGNLGYEAQLVVAVLKNSGAVRGRPHFDFRGDGNTLECRAGFIPAGEDAIVWTEWLAISSITVKNSPLWKTNPKQQFGYLQARNWARLYAPDALLGIYTDDELSSAPPADRHMGPVDEVRPELPAYAQADFEKNLPAWRKVVASGKKTASELLTMLQTKATFSDRQKAEILSLKVEAQDASPAPAPAAATTAAAEEDPFITEMDAEANEARQ